MRHFYEQMRSLRLELLVNAPDGQNASLQKHGPLNQELVSEWSEGVHFERTSRSKITGSPGQGQND